MPKNKPFKVFSRFLDIWGAKVFLFIGPQQDFIKYLKKRFKFDAQDIWDQNCLGVAFKITVNEVRKGYGIYMPSFDNSIDDIVILSHQCIHVTDDILNDRNVQHGDQNKEALTYTHDAIYRYFLEKLKC